MFSDSLKLLLLRELSDYNLLLLILQVLIFVFHYTLRRPAPTSSPSL